ncbi:hypothetical protein [[Mycoplasma] collis]|uniref:hypothetical protein n=1 Tax=[Mycoplasma] collis TaxID=2127 RepID=UPI00051B5F7F|nr:hypothetical protein [[Mycoplasma] collis]
MIFSKIYIWKKISVIYSVILAFLTFIFFYLFFNEFNVYLLKEKEFHNLKNIEDTFNYSQKNIFIIFYVLLSLLLVIVIIFSFLWIYKFFYLKNIGNKNLKIILFTATLIIILISILLSFQPNSQKKVISITNNENTIRRQIALESPKYIWGWILFFFWTTGAILNIIALKNYGFFIDSKQKKINFLNFKKTNSKKI